VRRLWLKLAFAGLGRRWLQAGLTVAVVAAAAAALTLALAVGGVASRPWDRTFAATNGAHVTAISRAADDLAAVARQPGVVASTGERPVAFTSFRHGGGVFGLRLVGVRAEPGAVDRLVIESGRRPGSGEVLLERSFARKLGLGPGDTMVTANGVRLRVSGIGVVAQGEPYPLTQPGFGFVRTATLARVAPDRALWAHSIGVRLTDPATASAFAARLKRLGPVTNVETWAHVRAQAVDAAKTSRVVLASFSVLLLLAAGFVLATLIGGRVLAQTRELALLKAAGLTPGELARVFLLEQLTLGLAGTAIGVTAGTLAAPAFVTRSASLLGAPETPAFAPLRVLAIAGVVLAFVAVFTLLPLRRVAGHTTASVLAAGVSASHAGRSRLGRLADRLGLPVPLALGARDAFANRGRGVVTVLCLALAVGSIVATFGMEASLDAAPARQGTPPAKVGGVPLGDPVPSPSDAAALRPVVYGLDAVLLCVAIANLVATILLGVRERGRDLGLLKAVGLTPRQVVAAFLGSQAVVASLAAVSGIPVGLGLFRIAIEASGSSDAFAYPAWWVLVLLVPAAVAVVLAIATPFARRAASLRTIDALRYE
jgi:putative ABC transport system permease protein